MTASSLKVSGVETTFMDSISQDAMGVEWKRVVKIMSAAREGAMLILRALTSNTAAKPRPKIPEFVFYIHYRSATFGSTDWKASRYGQYGIWR